MDQGNDGRGTSDEMAQMLVDARSNTVGTLAALENIVNSPQPLSIDKVSSDLTAQMAEFILQSPMYFLATSDADGVCDVSPRGDPAGSIAVPNHRTIVLPDRQGNNRVDSLRNLVSNSSVGLLFVVPGSVETLRVNGNVTITRHQPLLDQMTMRGKPPRLALIVDVAEAYMHCGRAFHRSNLWLPASWPSKQTVPSMASILKDQLDMPGNLDDLEAERADRYEKTLY